MKSSLSTKKKNPSASPGTKTKSKYSYIYCIVPANNHQVENLQIEGVEGGRIYTIPDTDFIAIVSGSAERKHEILDDGVTHQKVVEAVQETGSVLPFGFGQVASERELRTFLKRRRIQIQTLFNKYSNKKQLSLKAYWNMDAVLQEIYNSDDKVRILKKQIATKPDVVAHKLKMELGERIAADLEALGSKMESSVFKSLDQLAEKSKKNKTLNKEMFLNAVFLVEDEKEKMFDEVVDNLEQQYGKSVNLKYTVSAPYDFVALKIK